MEEIKLTLLHRPQHHILRVIRLPIHTPITLGIHIAVPKRRLAFLTAKVSFVFEHSPGRVVAAMRSLLKHVGAVALARTADAILPLAILAGTAGALRAAGREIAPCFAAGYFFVGKTRAIAAEGVAGRRVVIVFVGHPRGLCVFLFPLMR